MAAKLWNKAPFVRLLTALITGICLQWYLQFRLPWLIGCFAISVAFILLYSIISLKFRYSLSVINGLFIYLALLSLGCLLVWQQDVRTKKDWIGHRLFSDNSIVVTLEEPLVEKANSYKALASFSFIGDSSMKEIEGQLLLYFKKDSVPPPLGYGSQIVFRKPLQEIKNAGNPGSFDYKTYSLYHGITHQAFLATDDYVVLPSTEKTAFDNFIFKSRQWVVETLRNYIKGEKEQGLAEALLIGYKDDLDKTLVQAYSNTGVVHIIAISGLHLGLIYGLLVLLTKKLKRNKKSKILRFLIILAALWLFSLLAGAQPSVLRSAFMFSVIAFGEIALRRTNIFNTLALSATILLCINPFWLWDVGFQLSYTAVLSIILFFQPIYNWYRPTNKLLDFFWKITAVTIAAQILTLPISIYHFHQVPTLFLIANFIAVPLSSVILLGEILLCTVSFIPVIAKLVGIALNYLIYLMNSFIEELDKLPFAVWNYLSISLPQMILLMVFAGVSCYWLMEKRKRYTWLALSCFAGFMMIRAFSFYKASNQQKMIVYNVPKHTAIDVINGRSYYFIGDSALLYDDFVRNFHLQPSRILHRISPARCDASLRSFNLSGKQFMIIDEDVSFTKNENKPLVDVVILSKNPGLYISNLRSAFLVKQVIIDGSVPPWKAGLWTKDCDSLKIPCYNVAEKGAFVMNW
jgi:competence protein ComEC